MANDPITPAQILTDAARGLGGGGSTGALATELDRLTGQLQFLQLVTQAAVESTRTNTQAVAASTKAGSESQGSSVAKAVFGVLGTGLGLSPLISGLLKLFGGGGGGGEAPPSFMKFELPGSRSVAAGVADGAPGAFGVDYGQGGVARAVTALAPQITVNVSAMDSQSFLDRRTDIALAVRQAMLESSVLNDVVREA